MDVFPASSSFPSPDRAQLDFIIQRGIADLEAMEGTRVLSVPQFTQTEPGSFKCRLRTRVRFLQCSGRILHTLKIKISEHHH